MCVRVRARVYVRVFDNVLNVFRIFFLYLNQHGHNFSYTQRNMYKVKES